MQSERVGLALIGCGGIGQYHLRVWGELPQVEPVGVFDVNADAARRAADKHGVKKVYQSLEEAVTDAAVDGVVVCTPNMAHRPCVVAALEAGKHCLCEKPLAASAADIKAMIAARDASGKILMTGQHMRFEQTGVALKRAIDAGRLGEVYYTRAWWLRRRMAPSTPGFLSKAQAGFGPGMDLGVHVLDLAMHLLGHPTPVSVCGFATQKIAKQPNIANQWGTFRGEDFEVEDFATGLIRFANGSVLSLEVSWLLNMTDQEKLGLWLHGTAGGASWPDLNISHVQDGHLVDSRILPPNGVSGHQAETAAFIEAIVNKHSSPVPAEESLQVARALDALYQSAESGREVRLD